DKGKPKNNHSISFVLKGDSMNTHGLGAKVFVYANGTMQVQEEYPVRGYLSTVDTKLLFGTGKNTKTDSVVVVWVNNKKQVLQDLNADSTYTVYQKDASEDWQPSSTINQKTFADVTAAVNALY